MSYQVICEHPKTIINRSLIRFIRLGGTAFSVDGGKSYQQWKTLTFKSSYKDQTNNILRNLSRCFKRYAPLDEEDYIRNHVRFSVNADTEEVVVHKPTLCEVNKKFNLDDFFFLNPDSGETCPIFVQVPCGHCVICKHRKRLSFAFRCEAESQVHDYLPLFITLTYDPKWLGPKQADTDVKLHEDYKLHYEDCQKFLKRLRMRLAREYNFPMQRLRYAVCGEYMPSSHMPHFHIILWGMPFIAECGKIALYKLIDKTWSIYDRHTQSYEHIGRTQTKSCESTKGVGKYVGKYVSKSKEKDSDEFLHSSTRHGGIGSPWIRQKAKYLLENPDITKLYYKDKHNPDSKVKSMPMCKYFIDKVFPTLSMSVPQKLRDAIGDYMIAFNNLGQYSKVLQDRYFRFFADLHLILPMSLTLPPRCLPPMSCRECINQLDSSCAVLSKYANRDYSSADYLQDRRTLYFSIVTARMPKIDTIKMADDIRKELAKEKSKYVYC